MIPIAMPMIGEEEKAAVLDVIQSGQLLDGPRVREFESCFASWSGARFAVATASGIAALHIAMLAHGIGPYDEVIVPAFGSDLPAHAAVYAGARPVFADIEPDYLTIDPRDLARRITPRTRAIVPVHLFGQPCDMDAIAEIADRYGLAIIEDAFQAHGSRYRGRPVGSWGTAVYSFGHNRNLTTMRGGMLTTNDAQVAERARLICAHMQPERCLRNALGCNYRMTDLEAAMGLVQMRKVDGWNGSRRANAAYLAAQLNDVSWLKLPVVRAGSEHAFSQFPVRVTRRETAAAYLKSSGIGVDVSCPVAIHRQPFYRSLSDGSGRLALPAAEQASKQVLSLPVHPALQRADLDQMIAVIRGQ